ncbi:unnamed protein product [Peniophora sp. CBMAI 1063]|nr:unnamed protein product [Peniophora sp. CBMAI 1063]
MSSQKDFTVAIVGGGIVGLVCAIALAREGIDVDVFEAASRYGEIGAGIGMGANAMRVLKDLGLLDDILARSESIHSAQNSAQFVRGAEPHDIVYDYPKENAMNGLGFHRAAFLDIIAGLLPNNVRSHFNKRCTSVFSAPSDRVRLRFADDTEHEVDLLIGTDGIKSAVRAQVLGADGDRLVHTGTSAFRALVPTQRLRAAGVREEFLTSGPRIYLGQEKHIFAASIMGGALFNVAAFTTDFAHAMTPAGSQDSWANWVSPTSKDEILAAFEDFGPDVRKILECIDGPANKWAIHGLYPPLETHVGSVTADGDAKDTKNVVLLGDSAHAMLPHMGAGASVGIEGAYVLKSLLSHPQAKLANLSDILRAYSEARVPRAHYVAIGSKRAGDVYQGHGPSGSSDEQRRADLDLQWEGVWKYDCQAEVARAVKTLEEGGVFQRN